MWPATVRPKEQWASFGLRNLPNKQIGHLSQERREPVEIKVHLMSFVEQMAKTWSTPGLGSITGSSHPHPIDETNLLPW
jgi:hypothetical protein